MLKGESNPLYPSVPSQVCMHTFLCAACTAKDGFQHQLCTGTCCESHASCNTGILLSSCMSKTSQSWDSEHFTRNLSVSQSLSRSNTRISKAWKKTNTPLVSRAAGLEWRIHFLMKNMEVFPRNKTKRNEVCPTANRCFSSQVNTGWCHESDPTS